MSENVGNSDFVNSYGNSSGFGKDSMVPEEIANRFNWGAFFLNWIWGIGNKVYFALFALLFAFIPFLGGIVCLGFSIWLGFVGNKLAWQNKQWESLEEFERIQKIWTNVGLILFFTCIILSIIIPTSITIHSR